MGPSAAAFPIQLLVVSRLERTMGIGLPRAKRGFECLRREVNRRSRVRSIDNRKLVTDRSHAWPRGHWDNTGVHTSPALARKQAVSRVRIEDGRHHEESGW
jgi:hypothetical protein